MADSGVPSVHVDLDPLWVYSEIDPILGKSDIDIYVSCLPNLFSLLDEIGIKAVLFCIAQDLKQKNYEILSKATQRGHLLGNHSLNHSSMYSKFTSEEKISDFRAAQLAFENLNLYPEYFRAPGYAGSVELNHLLSDYGYKFDCSRMPTLYTTMMDLYFKMFSRPRKKFISFLRFSDWNYLFHKCPNDLNEIFIGTRRHFSIPIYSTSIWLTYRPGNKKLRGDMQVPLLFHAVDFLNFHDPQSGIPALRVPFDVRMSYIQNQIAKLG